MIYLMTPYYSNNMHEREHRAKIAGEYAKELMLKGIVVQSPVLLYHPLIAGDDAILDKVPYDFWMQCSANMLKHCEAAHLLMLTGYEESRGVAAELEWAKKLCIPVKRIEVPAEKQYTWYK